MERPLAFSNGSAVPPFQPPARGGASIETPQRPMRAL